MHPTNLEIILDDAKLIESRACRDALLEATALSTCPSKASLLAALDELPWQSPFFDLLRAAILKKEPVGKIALQAFAGPAFLPAFLEIGSALLALSPDIRAVRSLAAKEGLFENDRNLRYIKEYPSMLFYVFGSMWLGRCLGLPAYDPRRTLENNGGSLYDEFFGTKRIRTLYTPTPTIGDTIAPEFLACLEELRDNPEFNAFSYVNLQSITSKSEGVRVQAIMGLNAQFPNIFFGITLPQNSRFFEDHNASALDLKEQLLHPANFSLENRIGSNDPGYYFPGGRERWQEALVSLFDRAYAITQDKCALTELVHLGIIRYHQMCCLKNKRSLLSTVACKESIDRGGKINAELFWATAPESPEKATIFFSMFQARALLTRRRFIVPERLLEIEALLTHVPQKEAMRFLHDICSEFQLDSAKIKFL